ncbi:unnamed protein product [Brassica rapa subsp. narinosa]
MASSSVLFGGLKFGHYSSNSMCGCPDSGKLILGPSPGWFTGAARTSGFQTHF